MTPEQLQERINALQKELDLLKNVTTIPFEIGKALSARMSLNGFPKMSLSSKTTASETQAVNEAGTATYSVAKPFDGMIEFQINGVTYYVGVYTSTT